MGAVTSSGWEKLRLEIACAAASDDLRALREKMQELFSAEQSSKPTAELYHNLNRVHDTLISRTVKMAERRLVAEGDGEPPLPYAFILVGSAGRSEQTPWSDQDNGLVYADPAPGMEDSAALYFSKLASLIRQGLESAGYPPCRGKVLADQALWRHSLTGWKRLLDGWFAEPVWENVRYLLIASDMRAVSGNPQLADDIKLHFSNRIQRNPELLLPLMANTLHHKVPLGLLGRIVTERYGEDAGGVDIKYGLYIPLVNAIRLLALESGIAESATLMRIEELVKKKVLPDAFGNACRDVFEKAMELRLATPFSHKNGHFNASGVLPAEKLTKACRLELRRDFRFARQLQKKVVQRVRISVKQP
ncbi:DUF294 nucleotidyltransferase-like domain-containing protein [Paenibacillus lutrae]|uniref:Nucleotidyltransferase n=1 Tax=Paenibacillus lutrae TaxID=2078573 RepID=A0A7X3FFN2_9BACL|nr:DUF294 nucleotidyltransferase-like domain-containing protein [Paenibacillus lutrae]MVO98531.1 nucleotidyltransferase [Paenibacillus lutrae]